MTAVTSRTTRSAAVISEVTSPTIYAPALLVALAISDVPGHGFIALVWGAIAGLFVGAIPLGFLKIGARRGRWESHHVRDRSARRAPFLVAIASVAVGVCVLYLGGAPRNLAALIIAMFVGLTVMMAVSHFWKISVHAGTAAGAAVILVVTFGPVGGVAGVVIAAAAAWSRVATGDHTAIQVVVGAAAGAAIAAAVYLPLH